MLLDMVLHPPFSGQADRQPGAVRARRQRHELDHADEPRQQRQTHENHRGRIGCTARRQEQPPQDRRLTHDQEEGRRLGASVNSPPGRERASAAVAVLATGPRPDPGTTCLPRPAHQGASQPGVIADVPQEGERPADHHESPQHRYENAENPPQPRPEPGGGQDDEQQPGMEGEPAARGTAMAVGGQAAEPFDGHPALPWRDDARRCCRGDRGPCPRSGHESLVGRLQHRRRAQRGQGR